MKQIFKQTLALMGVASISLCATAATINDYVKDGLIAHFDAIHNVGADKPHDPTTRVWKNLVAGGVDFIIVGSGDWANGKAFAFDGATYAITKSPLDFGANNDGTQVTIELAMGEMRFPSNSSFYPKFYFSSEGGAGASNPWGQFHDAPHWEYCQVYPYLAQRDCPQLPRDAKRLYLTARATATDVSFFDGTTITNTIAKRKEFLKTSFSGKKWTLAGQDEGNVALMVGNYYSFRIYNRALTPAELEHNRKIDNARFHAQSGDPSTF